MIEGDAGNDRISGGDGADVINSGPGDDIVVGGAGNDTISNRGRGRVHIDGGRGNDELSLDGLEAPLVRNRDRIVCGPGRDRVAPIGPTSSTDRARRLKSFSDAVGERRGEAGPRCPSHLRGRAMEWVALIAGRPTAIIRAA